MYTPPFFCRKKGDFTRVFDTPIRRKPTASERQNSKEIVRKRFGSRKHTFPYKAANRLIIVNDKRRFTGNEAFEVTFVRTVQVVSLVPLLDVQRVGKEANRAGKTRRTHCKGVGGVFISVFF